jgi:hypothetical protein
MPSRSTTKSAVACVDPRGDVEHLFVGEELERPHHLRQLGGHLVVDVGIDPSLDRLEHGPADNGPEQQQRGGYLGGEALSAREPARPPSCSRHHSPRAM